MSMKFSVVVDVATARPPKVDAQVFVQVIADHWIDAMWQAAAMADCHPHVVMVLQAKVL